VAEGDVQKVLAVAAKKLKKKGRLTLKKLRGIACQTLSCDAEDAKVVLLVEEVKKQLLTTGKASEDEDGKTIIQS